MKKSNFVYFLIFSSYLQAAGPNTTIVRYQEERDYPAIKTILDDYAGYLRYESTGQPTGTTEKYLKSPSYITDVIRTDDNKTVGFINYAAYDVKIFTFYFGREGLIHLIGVDKE